MGLNDNGRLKAGRRRQPAAWAGSAHHAGGYILVISLLVLLLMGIIAASLLKGNVTQEQVASNVAGKVRAEQAADAALNYAETWLTVSRNASSGVKCPAGVVYTAPVVCNATSPAPGTYDPTSLLVPVNSPPSATNVSPTGTVFVQPAMMVSGSGGANSYYQDPRYYIQFISLVTNSFGTPVGSLYKITAGAYGGNINQVAIVQAYYKVYGAATPTTGP